MDKVTNKHACDLCDNQTALNYAESVKLQAQLGRLETTYFRQV